MIINKVLVSPLACRIARVNYTDLKEGSDKRKCFSFEQVCRCRHSTSVSVTRGVVLCVGSKFVVHFIVREWIVGTKGISSPSFSQHAKIAGNADRRFQIGFFGTKRSTRSVYGLPKSFRFLT
jgi:hypothetical protein